MHAAEQCESVTPLELLTYFVPAARLVFDETSILRRRHRHLKVGESRNMKDHWNEIETRDTIFISFTSATDVTSSFQ